MKKNNDAVTRKISSEIGYAILNKFNGSYRETYDFINKCSIKNIEAFRKRKKIVVNIILSRPGIFIGKKGMTISYIKDYLKESNNGFPVEINIKETCSWEYFLYPMTDEEMTRIGGF